MGTTRIGNRAPRNSANTTPLFVASGDGQIPHRHRRIDAGTETARGDRADLLGRGRIRKQRRAFAHRRAALGPQARHGGAVRHARSCAKILSAPGKPPARAPPLRRLFWIDHSSAPSTGVVHGVDVVTIEAKPGFEPQAVARAEPDRQHVAVGQAAFSPALRRARLAPRSQNRPRRYSPSARRNNRCRRRDAGRHP